MQVTTCSVFRPQPTVHNFDMGPILVFGLHINNFNILYKPSITGQSGDAGEDNLKEPSRYSYKL